MIAGIIVLGSSLLALIFAIAWLARPDWRAEIESPKHALAARLRHHERASLVPEESPIESADEHA